MAFRLTPRLRALSVLPFLGRPDRRRVGLSLCWEVLDDPFHRAVSKECDVAKVLQNYVPANPTVELRCPTSASEGGHVGLSLDFAKDV